MYLIENTKTIIQVHPIADQMTELKVHASNNVKSIVLEFYSRISVENALKKLKSVKLVFKESVDDTSDNVVSKI